MLCKHLSVVLLVSVVGGVGGFRECYPGFNPPPAEVHNSSAAGYPLYLTPYLEFGLYELAQRLSRVSPDLGNTTSYSGFFTVDTQCKSNLFFWFFPAQRDDWEDAPLLLWLEGGPGCTSLMSLFEEIGPFASYEDGLKSRPYSWNTENNLLIIDEPVGTGFSYTGKHCYPTNDTLLGENLYQAVKQFHMLFPNFQKNKFFIAARSFGGHSAPALARAIYQYNSTSDVLINLEAIMIGNGMMDFSIQNDYSSYLYQLGLVDDSVRDEMKSAYEECLSQLRLNTNVSAMTYYCETAFTQLYIQHVGRNVSMYDYLPQPYLKTQNWDEFIQMVTTRKALHVGGSKFNWGGTANTKLSYDSMGSVTSWLEELLEIYHFVFYNGQQDIICNYRNMVTVLRSLSWSGQEQYLNATRRSKWCVEKELAGYYKGAGNLYEVLIRGEGHFAPKYQPLWVYTLVSSVTSGAADALLHALDTC